MSTGSFKGSSIPALCLVISKPAFLREEDTQLKKRRKGPSCSLPPVTGYATSTLAQQGHEQTGTFASVKAAHRALSLDHRLARQKGPRRLCAHLPHFLGGEIKAQKDEGRAIYPTEKWAKCVDKNYKWQISMWKVLNFILKIREWKSWLQPWLVWLSGLSAGCEPRGRRFNSQLGHMPGFWARSTVVGAREATTHRCFFPCLCPSLPPL